MRTPHNPLAALIIVGLLVACKPESDQVTFQLQSDRFAGAEWSTPVNLGPVVNSDAAEANAFLSQNEHEMYFISTRTGGLGLQDIWVTRRQCLTCDWEAPTHLDAPINSVAADVAPTLSDDGKLLFLSSARTGGLGSGDLYVSQRLSAAGDQWSDPVNLGPDVNTAGNDQGSYYVKLIGEGNASLYFNRPGPSGTADVYKVLVSEEGMPLGPAVLVSELSDPAGGEQKVAVRTDGHELFLSATRTGGFGNFDIYVYTRQSANDIWSGPIHLDAPINTANLDAQPSLSRDGRTLIFTSIRTGGLGLQDLWMSTRTPSGR
jgi:WD40-like Beta Propeller Repeat